MFPCLPFGSAAGISRMGSLTWRDFSARRQRLRAGESFEQIDNLYVARRVPDGFCQILRHQRFGVLTDEFEKFPAKLRIFERLAHGFLKDFGALLRRAGRQHVWRSDNSKNTPHGYQLLFSVGFGEALN